MEGINKSILEAVATPRRCHCRPCCCSQLSYLESPGAAAYSESPAGAATYSESPGAATFETKHLDVLDQNSYSPGAATYLESPGAFEGHETEHLEVPDQHSYSHGVA